MDTTCRFEVARANPRFSGRIEIEFADRTVRDIDFTDDIYGPNPGVFESQ
ncbi:hypothetical protein [Gordonia liuliyuniae]|uniref:Uncharacterized protein n=1 Tax=Gordonia liuliyuniae TaxID=2911517 RepID=A0ABS9IWH9_9ACTN|nr:hypothetical protein [Gordonia liuliyuniae]MCF8589914.1 hypothetical protein [Gordonia liuliyuniae]